jgi:hypothetical protein
MTLPLNATDHPRWLHACPGSAVGSGTVRVPHTRIERRQQPSQLAS